MKQEFFPARIKTNPTIYAYELVGVETHKGLLKIGYTDRDAKTRVKEQLGTANIQYNIVFEDSAMKNDGSSFTDHDIHRHLRNQGFSNPEGEWFVCTVNDLRKAIWEIKTGERTEENRVYSFGIRPEQQKAVDKTMAYFNSFKNDPDNKRDRKTPHFLWNAKMRFGKTFTAYQLAKTMGWSKVLVLTFKPAVQHSWEEDLLTHVDFEGWEFISKDASHIRHQGTATNNTENFVPSAALHSPRSLRETKPIVCFGSFQDYLGKNDAGGIKTKNEWVHATHWDCVIFDEYHYGAWRENAKELFEAEDNKEKAFAEGDGMDYFDEENMPITTNHYLYLSGTPFRAIASGEFIEEQIFNWTYSDEQRAKAEWDDSKGNNPYASLPRMVMMTYQLPDSIAKIADLGEFDGFDLNVFFSAEGDGNKARFKYEDEVQKWLDLIRGSFSETTIDSLKLGAKKPPLPFSHAPLLNVLNHSFWFLPSVAACYAQLDPLKKY